MAEKLVGVNYAVPDLRAKITGRARYAEDFRAQGMVFMKLLLSPMPHCRVRGVDDSRARQVPGFIDIMRASEVTQPEEGAPQEAMLTDEPKYEGEPILAVAAENEEACAAAIEAIELDLEPLPFVLDPLQSLRPSAANAFTQGNQYTGQDGWTTYKWTDADFAEIEAGRMPNPTIPEEGAPNLAQWTKGDIDAGFAEATLILEETIVHQSVTHHPMEPRSTMAYWENGRLHAFVSTQSAQRTKVGLAGVLDIDPESMTFVSEFTGGGFGSKIPGHPHMALAPLMSRKINRPVMHRVTRYEENYIGRARPGFQTWVKMGFRADGKCTAIDMITVQDSGPYGAGDHNTASNIADLTYTPGNMRYRGFPMRTNTPPKAAQRGPGGAQINGMLEPIIDKAARELGIDRLAMRILNAPGPDVGFGPNNQRLTSVFAKEALQRGAELFDYPNKIRLSGQRVGSKVTGIGMGLSTYTAGSRNFDGLMVIRPDGKLYVYQGIGNLGTHSISDTARPAAELLGLNWDQVEIIWGDSSRGMPNTSVQAGSQTTHAHTRANYAAAQDALRKIRAIAARQLGGNPNQYRVDLGRVMGPGGSMTFAQVAQRAIALGGEYDGHEVPRGADGNPLLNAATLPAVAMHAGTGLVGVARDDFGGQGGVYSWLAVFGLIELDVETGHFETKECVCVTDCGTVIHPRSLAGQSFGGTIQGMGMAMSQRWVFDPQYGVPFANRLYTARPPSIMDAPRSMVMEALNIPDPTTPVGAKGIGEPSVGAGSALLTTAIADAMGGRCLCRTPLTPDIILAELEGRPLPFGRLDQHVG